MMVGLFTVPPVIFIPPGAFIDGEVVIGPACCEGGADGGAEGLEGAVCAIAGTGAILDTCRCARPRARLPTTHPVMMAVTTTRAFIFSAPYTRVDMPIPQQPHRIRSRRQQPPTA